MVLARPDFGSNRLARQVGGCFPLKRQQKRSTLDSTKLQQTQSNPAKADLDWPTEKDLYESLLISETSWV